MKRYSVTVEGTDYDMPSYRAACSRFRAEQHAGAKSVRLWDWKDGARGVVLASVEDGKVLRALTSPNQGG